MNDLASSKLVIALLAASALALPACSAPQPGGTHEMGPPGRSETMANGFMLQQSTDTPRF
ncbi:MAG: hypothetical protein WA771_06795 [Chthoniobacterales bacterium]